MQENTTRRQAPVALWVIVILLAVFLLVSLALNAGLAFGLLAKSGKSFSRFERAADEYPHLIEQWSYGKGRVKAARISVEGVIMRETEGGLFEPPEDHIENILRQIRSAQNDEHVMAIVLEVDSPGGAITPSDEIYRALMDFKQSSSGRKIVVFIRDLAASGGYYVALAGDWLIAEPTSVIGSVGVLVQTLNWKELGEKIGVRDITIKSGPNKDLLNPFLDLPPEQREMLQEMIDAMHRHFVSLVLASRPSIDAAEIDTLTDGRIFSAQRALEHKLIDQIGYWNDAMAKTRELLGESSVKFIRYEKQPEFFRLFARARMPFKLSPWSGYHHPRFMYLWKP